MVLHSAVGCVRTSLRLVLRRRSCEAGHGWGRCGAAGPTVEPGGPPFASPTRGRYLWRCASAAGGSPQPRGASTPALVPRPHTARSHDRGHPAHGSAAHPRPSTSLRPTRAGTRDNGWAALLSPRLDLSVQRSGPSRSAMTAAESSQGRGGRAAAATQSDNSPRLSSSQVIQRL